MIILQLIAWASLIFIIVAYLWWSIRVIIPLIKYVWAIRPLKADKVSKIRLDGKGWIKINDNRVEIVNSLKRIKDLEYRHIIKQVDGYDPDEEYIVVMDDVGQAIEMYVRQNESYAGMALDEFILKTLFNHISDASTIDK